MMPNMGLLNRLKSLFVSRWPSKVHTSKGVPIPPVRKGHFAYRQKRPQNRKGWTGRWNPDSQGLNQGGEELPADMVDEFLAGDLAQHVDSSWLSYMRYMPDAEELECGFLDGAAVVVEQVDYNLALSAARAYSKGGWYWDNVLVRGEGNKSKTQRPVRNL